MREKLKTIYHSSKIVTLLLSIPKFIFDFYRYRILNDKIFLKFKFKQYLGYYPNLNNPKTFSEKLQWLKLYDRTPLHTICADKFAVRKFIAKEVGDEFLIPIFLHTNDVKSFNPVNLPNEPFIIKATHSSGRNLIVSEPGKMDWNLVRKKIKKWLKENFYYSLREWQYKNIPPAIIVEELLQEENGEIPRDFKFFCFNGQIEYIEVHENRHGDHKKLL